MEIRWKIHCEVAATLHMYRLRHSNGWKSGRKGKTEIFKRDYAIVDGAVSSNRLIVWNSPFGVDDPFTEKPVV